MAERITITISDTLRARLQAVRKKLNISAVCQEAIEHVVSIEELKMAGKEKVIERLRLERKKTTEEWFECGKIDSFKDVEVLSYEKFEQLWDLYQNKGEIERYQWIALDQFPDEFHELLQKRLNDYSPKPNEQIYLAGWIDGVTEFWAAIADEI